MQKTLFYIPDAVGQTPLFGFGILLALLAIACAATVFVVARRQGWTRDTWSYLPVFGFLAVVIVLVLPAISEPGRGVPIRGYGVMLLLAVASGVGMALYRARRMGVNPELIVSLAFWLFVAGIVGARLFYVIEYWPKYRTESFRQLVVSILKINEGGLVVFGSLIGAAVAFAVFVHRRRLPALALADLIAPSLAIGLAFGRVGCFMNGCCFGGAAELPWAVQFPAESPPHIAQQSTGQLFGVYIGRGEDSAAPIIGVIEPQTPAADSGLHVQDTVMAINGYQVSTIDEARDVLFRTYDPEQPLLLSTAAGAAALPIVDDGQRSRRVHPTQLYSAIDAGLLCLLLLAYYPFRRHDGEVIALLLTIHPISRFLLEVIRTDEAPVFGTQLSISQNISLLLLAAAAVLWVYVLKQPRGSALPPPSTGADQLDRTGAAAHPQRATGAGTTV